MDAQFNLKRHHPQHHHHHHNRNFHHPPPPPQPPQPPQPPHQPKPSTTDAHFRILCPAGKAGGVIGKGGAVIRQLREDTGARIRIIDDFAPSHCEERIILISASANPNPNLSNGEVTERGDESRYSVAQAALMRVFERILKVDEERGEIGNSSSNNHSGGGENGGNCKNGNGENGVEGNGGGEGQFGGNVVCRMLVGGNQIGCVLGKGGKIVEMIRQESGAQVRIMPKEAVPPCASPGDELIQMVGNFQAVKKAILLVSSCLQEQHPKTEVSQGMNNTIHTDSFPPRGSHATDHHSRGFMAASASEIFGPNHRMFPEEDVLFRLLCPVEKIGNLIGKGGFVIRGIQSETGASIKINDAVAPDSDERVVVISAREGVDLKQSPAQDAVIRVHSRIAEIGFELGVPVVARLLVSSQQIGCLLGKGGHIIAEMRRATGANIRIFGRDQGLKICAPNDEVVQVIGNIPAVQDALFQITSRIRETLIPSRQQFSQVSSSTYSTSYSELPSPSFRPRHDQTSPSHFHSPVGYAHGYDSHSVGHGPIRPSGFPHGSDRAGEYHGEPDYRHYGGDRPPYGPSYEQPSSPRAWYPQAVNSGHPSRFPNAGIGPSVTSTSESGQQMQITKSVEVVVPQILLPHVYGENKSNLSHITQLSGADVIVHDPKPGETEGRVLLSGSPSQLHTAQCLVHAFIFCGQAY